MRDIKFRALAHDKKDCLKWFDDVITDGQEVWIYTKYQGVKHLKEVKALVQYTGLKDKNGVEIYNFDIVEVGNYVYIVEINLLKGLFFRCIENLSLRSGSIYFTSFVKDVEFEVIGNIYEHSHLLDNN